MGRERAGQRPRVVEPPRHGDGFLGELAARSSEAVNDSATESRASTSTLGAESSGPRRPQRLVEQVGLHAVPQPHLEAGQSRGEAERRPGDQVGVVAASPDVGSVEERLARPVEVARAEPRLTGEEQEGGAAR